jgi:hypothetical protein
VAGSTPLRAWGGVDNPPQVGTREFDCADPDVLTRFWAPALGYRVEGPPAGFDDWRSYWAHIGLPEDELVDSGDAIVDPDGVGPRIWFQVVPEANVVKNRVHLDLDVSGGPPAFACSSRKGSITSRWCSRTLRATSSACSSVPVVIAVTGMPAITETMPSVSPGSR